MMNYPLTQGLIDFIKEIAPNSPVAAPCTEKDWRGNVSDFVIVDETNHVGFEVFENEVIAFYFTEHHHFEDYSSSLEDGQPSYGERAQDFLKDLFTCTIRHEKTYKGKTLIAERYVFVYDDNTEDCPAGVWIHGILARINPFLGKHTESKLWKYDMQSGVFMKIT